MKKVKILISKEQYDMITEAFGRKTTDLIAGHIRELLKKVYQPLGKWGSIQNPDNNCETGEGVIGVYPHLEGEDDWSILNRFDTNSKVRDRMRQIFMSENPESTTDSEFMKWMTENKQRLFNGEFTEELVSLNRTTIERGNQNEKLVIDVLQRYFGTSAIIKRFCSGDVRDTKKGMDISVEINGKIYYVQVKPFENIGSYVDQQEGETFFQVKSYFDPKKYSEKNVDIFFFVKDQNYIAFQNVRSKIKQTSQNYTNFYEPWLMTNIEFDTNKKPKRYRKLTVDKQEEVKSLFKTSERKIENLMFKKKALEDLIKIEMEKLKKLKSKNKK